MTAPCSYGRTDLLVDVEERPLPSTRDPRPIPGKSRRRFPSSGPRADPVRAGSRPRCPSVGVEAAFESTDPQVEIDPRMPASPVLRSGMAKEMFRVSVRSAAGTAEGLGGSSRHPAEAPAPIALRGRLAAHQRTAKVGVHGRSKYGESAEAAPRRTLSTCPSSCPADNCRRPARCSRRARGTTASASATPVPWIVERSSGSASARRDSVRKSGKTRAAAHELGSRWPREDPEVAGGRISVPVAERKASHTRSGMPSTRLERPQAMRVAALDRRQALSSARKERRRPREQPPMRVREPEQVPNDRAASPSGLKGGRLTLASRSMASGSRSRISAGLFIPDSTAAEVVEVLVGVRPPGPLAAALESRKVCCDCAPTLLVEGAVLVPPHQHEEAQEDRRCARREPCPVRCCDERRKAGQGGAGLPQVHQLAAGPFDR